MFARRVRLSPFSAALGLGITGCLSGAPGAVTTDAGASSHDSAVPQVEASTPSDSAPSVDRASPVIDAGHDASDTAPPPDVKEASVDVTPAADVSPPPAGDAGSRCTMTPLEIVCSQETHTVTTPAGSDPEAGTVYPAYQRVVHYQIPLGTAPAQGWPAVLLYQGAYVSAGLTFSASSSDLYGMYYQTELVKLLLDAGYAVLAPEALADGDTYWQTNVAPYAASWAGAPDDVLVQTLLADIKTGTFGPLDSGSLYAAGISSGGYMTSRMAVSYAGTFKALAIESGAYATCCSGVSAATGGACAVPSISSSHPPTLFLHGELDVTVVPEWTVQEYESALKLAGVAYDEVDDPASGHQWIPEAPAAVLEWFQAYP